MTCAWVFHHFTKAALFKCVFVDNKSRMNRVLVFMSQYSQSNARLAFRAIYFAAYSTAKEKLNGVLEPDSTQVHMVSAGMAGNDGSFSPPRLSVRPSACLSVTSACLCVCLGSVTLMGFI